VAPDERRPNESLKLTNARNAPTARMAPTQRACSLTLALYRYANQSGPALEVTRILSEIGMSKYAPLAEHLRRLPSDEVRLSFNEVEQILGFALPASAARHQAWWGNSRKRSAHTWAYLWHKAGWARTRVRLADRWVEFSRVAFFELDSAKAHEGYEVDRMILARARNAGIVAQRKARDDFTCQACDFRLAIDGRYVIEVHHLDPLSGGERESTIEDVVSLCPTCHRIAHLRSPPYSIEEIRDARQAT
jgi:hypothetical protein